jgi:hypothetical protein
MSRASRYNSKVRKVDFAEVRNVERAVGRAGVRPWPWHFWAKVIESGGVPSPELVKAADRAREFYRTVDIPALSAAAPAAAPAREEHGA